MISLCPMTALTLNKLKCQSCGHARDVSTEKSFAFTTSIPRPRTGENSVNLTECIKAYSKPDKVESTCESCSGSTNVFKWMELKALSSYILINVNRVVANEGQNIAAMTRNPCHINLPPSEVVSMRVLTEDIGYEVIGQMKHSGLK